MICPACDMRKAEKSSTWGALCASCRRAAEAAEDQSKRDDARRPAGWREPWRGRSEW